MNDDEVVSQISQLVEAVSYWRDQADEHRLLTWKHGEIAIANELRVISLLLSETNILLAKISEHVS